MNRIAKNYFYFFIALSMSAFVSCGGKKERPVHLDILICESPKDNRLTEQQVQMLIPFEKDNIRYLAQGSILNSINRVSYSKEKTWWKKLGSVQKRLFTEQELVGNHLKGLDLSSLSLEYPLSEDDMNWYIGNYEFILGFNPELSGNLSTESFKIYTRIEDVLSYIRDEVLISDPDVSILIVYNPPKSSIMPDSIILDKTALIIGRAGEKAQLTATVFPAEISEENKRVVWESDNEAVAKVDTTGLVTARANGHAVIRAYVSSGISDTCSVEVKITVSTTATPAQLNNLLGRIRRFDDDATDRFRSILGNSLPVEGATNISNVQQLITDVSNGNNYTVRAVNTDGDGKIVSISVRKL